MRSSGTVFMLGSSGDQIVLRAGGAVIHSLSGNQLVLNWTGSGILTWSPSASGPWTEMGITSAPPQLMNLILGENRFFRIKGRLTVTRSSKPVPSPIYGAHTAYTQ
jgi:hypothetical protein